MDDIVYSRHSKQLFKAYEGLCKRCGRCCGLENDLCAELVKQADGTYLCRDYQHRIGKHRTVGGNEFTCVEIRDHVALGYTIAGCPYFS